MHWNVEQLSGIEKRYDGILAICILLFLVGMLASRPLIFALVGILLGYLVLIRLYDRQIGRNLALMNERKSLRLFIDEETNLEIVIKNHSFMPIFQGTLMFTLGDELAGTTYLKSRADGVNSYQIPVSVMGKSEVRISLPVKAVRRGVVRFRDIRMIYPHPFNFHQITMNYQLFYQTEILVYPKLEPVLGMKELSFHTLGEQASQYSPYEDLLSPIGTRDYVIGDPFYRIHWKASAKTQRLQTKIYERNQDITWNLVVNLASKSPFGNLYSSKNFEELIAYTAFICKEITKQNESYELNLNMSAIGNNPIMLDEGNGVDHYKKTLEFLARLKAETRFIPLENLLYRIDKRARPATIIVMIGELVQENTYLERLRHKGVILLQLVAKEQGAFLQTLGDERLRVI